MEGLPRGDDAQTSRIDGDTPTMRLIALLEVIASKDEFVTLQGLVEETGLPKPTLHRMLHQLESARLLQREHDGRSYGTGARLRRLAENLLLNDTAHGARRAVLRRLKDEVGESCNITALSGGDVLYLDRVETAAPLRFYLHPGSRVPAHCSASGKLFLAQMTPAQRTRVLGPGPLQRYTPNTITEPEALERELAKVRAEGYALDDEEFLPGLVCIAVLVPAADGGRSNVGLAVQAPIMRLTAAQAVGVLPVLRRAALDLMKADDQPSRGGRAPRQGDCADERLSA
ncbi:MAG: IclR family transcriptional regulator [Anaerolineae bacterium]|nr:IclR family transcriptional regulator [Anaerolineae bacterium]